MRFSKKGNIYKIIRITGSQDNILGISFSEKNKIQNNIEVIEWQLRDDRKNITSKEEIVKQVISGLQEVNKSLETNYQLSKIYFDPADNASNSVYKLLIALLIRHYHNEVKKD